MPQQFFLAVIEKQLPVWVRNVCAKNFLVNINVDLLDVHTMI